MVFDLKGVRWVYGRKKERDGSPISDLQRVLIARRKSPDCSYLSLFIGVRIGGWSEGGGYHAGVPRLTKHKSKE